MCSAAVKEVEVSLNLVHQGLIKRKENCTRKIDELIKEREKELGEIKGKEEKLMKHRDFYEALKKNREEIKENNKKNVVLGSIGGVEILIGQPPYHKSHTPIKLDSAKLKSIMVDALKCGIINVEDFNDSEIDVFNKLKDIHMKLLSNYERLLKDYQKILQNGEKLVLKIGKISKGSCSLTEEQEDFMCCEAQLELLRIQCKKEYFNMRIDFLVNEMEGLDIEIRNISPFNGQENSCKEGVTPIASLPAPTLIFSGSREKEKSNQETSNALKDGQICPGGPSHFK